MVRVPEAVFERYSGIAYPVYRVIRVPAVIATVVGAKVEVRLRQIGNIESSRKTIDSSSPAMQNATQELQ